MRIWAVVAAGGAGVRFGSDTPKQFFLIRNKPVLSYSVETLSSLEDLAGMVIVAPEGSREVVFSFLDKARLKEGIPYAVITGGRTRKESVRNGLETLYALWADDGDIAIIHDAARPFVTADEFLKTAEAAERHGAAFLGTKASDTVKAVENGVISTIPREKIILAATPQSFKLGEIYRAHVESQDSEAYDDCVLLERKGISPAFVEGGANCFKITEKSDLDLAEVYLRQ